MAQPPATVTVNVSTLSNALAVAIQQAAVTSGRDQSASASATIGTRVTRQQSGAASSSSSNAQDPT